MKPLERLSRRVELSDYYLAFVLLNLGDLFLTGIHFQLGGWEANRAAAWVIHAFGLRGLVVYKFALVVGIIGICEVVCATNQRLARQVILGGSIAIGLVVAYQIRNILMLALDALPL